MNPLPSSASSLLRAIHRRTPIPKRGELTTIAVSGGGEFELVRLDLGRVGLPLDPTKLATEYGKTIARKSEGVPVFKMREWIRTL